MLLGVRCSGGAAAFACAVPWNIKQCMKHTPIPGVMEGDAEPLIGQRSLSSDTVF